MIKTYGLDATKRYYRTMRESVALVRDNLDRHGIDAWAAGDGEVTLAHLPSRVAELREDQAFLARTFGEETEFLSRGGPEGARPLGPHFHGGPEGATRASASIR